MQSNIRNGKFVVEPASLEAACFQRKRLHREIATIDGQLCQPGREKLYKGSKDYTTWRASATKRRDLFKLERRLLTDWIIERVGESEQLLKQTYELLKQLQGEDVDFDETEAALIAKLDEKFRRTS